MMERMLQPNNVKVHEADLYTKLSGLISEFEFNALRGMTFESWFGKHSSYFEIEGKELPESVKVRLLVSKLGPEEYAQFERKMLPVKLSEMKFTDLISELSKEFGDPRSKLFKRFEALNDKCSAQQDIVEFGNRVNAQCERAQMSLSIEELKILIFISGIPSEQIAVRQMAMKFVENKTSQDQPVSLKEVIDQCRNYLANKSEAVYMSKEKPAEVKEVRPIEVNLVQKKKSSESLESKKGRDSQCQWSKPNDFNKPWRSYGHKPEVKCYNCGNMGHLAWQCSSSKYYKPKVNYRNNYHSGAPFFGIGEVSERLNPVEWITKTVKVNGHKIEMIVDTGSQMNIVTPKVWEKIGCPKLEEVKFQGKGIGETSFEIKGKWKCFLEVDRKEVKVEMCVVKGSKNVLGLPVLQKISDGVKFNKYKSKKYRNQDGKVSKFNLFPNGTKVKVKNTNNRTGRIEWLSGEVIRKTDNAWKIKVPILKNIITRSAKEIRNDDFANSKKSAHLALQNLDISKNSAIEATISEGSINSAQEQDSSIQGTSKGGRDDDDNSGGYDKDDYQMMSC
uniref:CCHC-type domain-containing protein n=1 Tax=Meloidogyne hapla TaxID=6305 RepID=A0A1I8B8D7_MELHA